MHPSTSVPIAIVVIMVIFGLISIFGSVEDDPEEKDNNKPEDFEPPTSSLYL